MTGCQRSIIMTAQREAFAFAVESRCNGKTWWPGLSVTTAFLLHLVTATDVCHQKWACAGELFPPNIDGRQWAR